MLMQCRETTVLKNRSVATEIKFKRKERGSKKDKIVLKWKHIGTSASD